MSKSNPDWYLDPPEEAEMTEEEIHKEQIEEAGDFGWKDGNNGDSGASIGKLECGCDDCLTEYWKQYGIGFGPDGEEQE